MELDRFCTGASNASCSLGSSSGVMVAEPRQALPHARPRTYLMKPLIIIIMIYVFIGKQLYKAQTRATAISIRHLIPKS